MSIIYKAKRIGLHGKPFFMYKFRTMVENADKIGGASTAGDDPRITPVGRVLRKFKLDELPQLWNVLIGDMSLVGPRPDVEEVINMMTPIEKRIILSVRPGITDLASLWDSNEEERLRGKPDPHQAYLDEIWPEKKRLQIQYVQNKSLLLDITIILKTIWKICARR